MPLPPHSMSRLEAISHLVSLPKGSLVVEAGKVEKDLFFIAEGIARAYYESDDGKEITFWIGREGDAVMSLKSYVMGAPGYENIELIEDSRLYRLSHEGLSRLYEEDVNLANLGRKLVEHEFVRAEAHMIPLLFTTAAQRYEALLRDNPDLLQRVPLECLASYLGVTPVSLSRIRAKIR